MSMTEIAQIMGKEHIWPQVSIAERIKNRIAMLNPGHLPKHDAVFKAFRNYEDFISYCYDKLSPTYEIWTEEYIKELGGYLAENAKKYGNEKITILEIGAGNGRLSYFLSEELKKQKINNAKIIATDKNPSSSLYLDPSHRVEKIDYQEALKKYNPTIVISSWMPNGVDMSQEIRNQQSVKEYILIGTSEFVGDGAKTWWSTHKKDGFVHKELEKCTKWQISRSDSPGHKPDTYTISYRRINAS